MRLAIPLLIILAGCTVSRPQKGGGATVGWLNPESAQNRTETPLASIQQPDNPNTSSGQESNYEKQEEIVLAEAATETVTTTEPTGKTVVIVRELPAGSIIRSGTSTSVKQVIGGSWKDTAREISAKLSSYKGVQFLGAGFLLISAACLHPVVRTILGGGKQLPMALAAIGVILVFGPSLVVGNEKVFVIGGIITAAFTYLLIRLSHKEGKEDAKKSANE